MTAGGKTPEGFSLKRWSRRKLEAVRTAGAPAAAKAPSVSNLPASAARPAGPVVTAEPAPAAAAALPPIESLTIDSDFTAFLQPKVDEALKRQALKKLFGDPRFNVMDGLDVYIDDYSKPDPISPELVKQLVQARYIFDPPQTRINEQGYVEDVPPDEAAAQPPANAVEAAPEPAPQASATEAPAAATAVPEAKPEKAAPDVAAPADPARPEPTPR